MAHMTGANMTPLGRLHPVLAGKQNTNPEPERPGIKRAVENRPGMYKLHLIPFTGVIQGYIY